MFQEERDCVLPLRVPAPTVLVIFIPLSSI